jgi:hypothetical protein
VSYPQCGQSLPSSAAFGIVGVDNGIVFSTNPCLSAQLSWAQQAANHAPGFYANTGNPGPAYSSHWPTGQTRPQLCDPNDTNSTACSYDYGWNAAADSFAYAIAAEQQVNGLAPDAATCARLVLDDDGLAQRLREFLGDDAAEDVGEASGRPRDDELDGLRRPVGRARAQRGCCEHADEKSAEHRVHCDHASSCKDAMDYRTSCATSYVVGSTRTP